MTVFEFRLPDIGEGIHEGELLAWCVQVGDWVAEDTPLAEVMTDKVTVELPSPVAGRVKALHGQVGELIAVGSLLVALDTSESSPATEAPMAAPLSLVSQPPAAAPLPESTPSPAPVAEAEAVSVLGQVLAAPATRALARQAGLPLTSIPASGPNGRITPADVKQAQQQSLCGGNLALPLSIALPATPRPADETFLYKGIRKTIGQRLQQVKQTAPEFALIEAFNLTRLEALRQELKPALAARGVRLTLLPFIMKALCQSLQAYPRLNSTWNEAQTSWTQSGGVQLSVAVDTPQGLLVPVLAEADRLDVLALAEGLQSLSHAARDGKLTPASQQGGTFTLSSVGAMGGLIGIPILNSPQVGILALGKASKQPVVLEDDTLGVGYVMHACLTADHRIVDGADAARFLSDLKARLEAPAALLLP